MTMSSSLQIVPTAKDHSIKSQCTSAGARCDEEFSNFLTLDADETFYWYISRYGT